MLSYALRAAALALIVPAYILGGRPPRDHAALAASAVRTSRWARLGCRVLGIRIDRRRLGRSLGGSGRMLALNHLSWIDPIIMAAIRPAIFVTSAETGEHPLLGRICASAGCVFMERRRKRGLDGECDRLGMLMSRLPVVVFPEATSSDGSRVLPFKPATFAAAISARAPVTLFALRYRALDGRRVTARNCDRVCWYGDMTFLPHLAGLLAIRRIDAEVACIGSLDPAGSADRKELARLAHDTVSSFLHPGQRGPEMPWA
jgi:1-acyl-sn-glycerol-3-phosphate acyltransferase